MRSREYSDWKRLAGGQWERFEQLDYFENVLQNSMRKSDLSSGGVSDAEQRDECQQ